MIHIAVHRRWLWSATPAGSPSRSSDVRRRSRPAPSVGAGERALAQSRLRDGGVVVASDRALVISDMVGSQRRVSWGDVASVEWAPSTASTVVTTWPGDDAPSTSIELRTDRRFAAFAAERVASTQVVRRRVTLTGDVSAIVVATRVFARDEITWRVLVVGRPTNDPEVVEAALRVLADLRALTGC